MGLIEWDNSYSVHNEEIDAQHKKWIEIYNHSHETMMKGNVQDLKTLTTDALQAMSSYANEHFQFEEEFMKKINYPELVEHRRIHKDFDTLINQYSRDIRDGKMVLNSEILKTIKKWLLDHILTEDKKYSIFAP